LRSTGRLSVVIAAIAPVLVHSAAAQTFEDLVEDALKRQREGEDAPGQPQPLVPLAPGEFQPLVPQTPGVAPPQPLGAPPPGSVLKPVELAPRPYTPPTVAAPPEGAAPPSGNAQQQDGTPAAPAPAQGVATSPGGAVPSPGAPATTTDGATQGEGVAATGGERTRESLQVAEVNAATFSEEALAVGGANPLILKTQVLLDRAGASPGVIDGYAGGNLTKAVAAVETVLRTEADGVLDQQVWEALRGDSSADAIVQYAITEQDLSYPFAAAIPDDYAGQARMPSLAYTSPQEMLGERFHMDVKLLAALNPEADFSRVGTTIWVTSVEAQPATGKVARIVADKTRWQVRAYDAQDRLIVAYPATIGSEENPSPTGEHTVEAIAPNPVYYYDPANFVQGDNTEKLELPPGPNNPVGSTWIDLTTPGYGIHGTPDPTKIGKTASHGCVRLTNWDAEELAGLVEPGVVVSFVE
jgi:lipoprotein-anchoring transpeptidase ErfK/SrfK